MTAAPHSAGGGAGEGEVRMDRQEQLRAYTLQIVALGQAALAIYRRGEWLPDELIALA